MDATVILGLVGSILYRTICTSHTVGVICSECCREIANIAAMMEEVTIEERIQLIIDQVLPALAFGSGVLTTNKVITLLQNIKCLRDTEVMQSKIWKRELSMTALVCTRHS